MVGLSCLRERLVILKAILKDLTVIMAVMHTSVWSFCLQAKWPWIVWSSHATTIPLDDMADWLFQLLPWLTISGSVSVNSHLSMLHTSSLNGKPFSNSLLGYSLFRHSCVSQFYRSSHIPCNQLVASEKTHTIQWISPRSVQSSQLSSLDAVIIVILGMILQYVVRLLFAAMEEIYWVKNGC